MRNVYLLVFHRRLLFAHLMNRLVVLLLFVSGLAPLAGKACSCSEMSHITVSPVANGGPISPNQLFILNVHGFPYFPKKLLQGTYAIYLLGGDQRTEVEIVDTTRAKRSDRHFAQVVVRPVRPLLTGQTYSMYMEPAGRSRTEKRAEKRRKRALRNCLNCYEPERSLRTSFWEVVADSLENAVQWRTLPKIGSTTSKSLISSCGDRYIWFSYQLEGPVNTLIKVNVPEFDGSITSIYAIGGKQQQISLGHNTCGGNFWPLQNPFNLTFDIILPRAPAIIWQAPPIRGEM